MNWDVKFIPESNEILDKQWCSGEIKLLLPIIPVTDDTTMIIYYQESVRGKNICIGDILYKIYNFYHFTKVIPGDLTYVSVSDIMRPFAENALNSYYMNKKSIDNLKFIDFLRDQTKFGGLKQQKDNVYSVRLLR